MSNSLFTVSEKYRLDIPGDFPLDEGLLDKLPTGTTIVSAQSHGFSAWTRTARLNVILKNGATKTYFLKVATDDLGKTMMQGEFESMTALYNTMSSFVPRPHAWGQFKAADKPTYFFLCDFIDMDNKLPGPNILCAQLAQLHRSSVSPTGKFGFGTTTCRGKCPQVVDWDSSWASFFAKMFEGAFEQDQKTNGSWEEFEELASQVITLVIPRLLGALQSGGRTINPCLIHGDLWDENIGTDFKTGKIYIFDAAAYYAHNEMEIGMWSCAWLKISAKIYKEQYVRYFGISEPKEEFDDRNRLYCVKNNLVHSALNRGSNVRQTAFEDLQYLVEKYGAAKSLETMDGVSTPTEAIDRPDSKLLF